MVERRAHPRVKGPFEGFWDGAGTQSGRVVDLSITGCFIESVMLPAIGQRVSVSVAITGGQVILPAEVIYTEGHLGFGVRFVDVPDQVSDLLREEIASKLPR